MPRNLTILGLCIALLAGCNGADAPATAGFDDGVTVLSGARLIDGSGGPAIENAVVVIRGDRFEAVGPEGTVQVPEGAEIIDVSGKTIMPPMVSLHMHLAMNSNGFDNNAANFNEDNIRNKLDQYARFGVLHVTSMGTDRPLVYDIRDRQRAGTFPGARIYTAGRGFGVPDGGYPPLQPGATPETDVFRLESPEGADEAVADLEARGADFVKLWVDHHFHTQPDFDREIAGAIVQAALDRGLRPVAHIHEYQAASDMLDAGVVGIVHSVRDRTVDQALIQKYLDNDAFSVATLAREESMFIYASRPHYLDDPFFTDFFPESVQQAVVDPEFQARNRDNPELHEWEPALRFAQQNLMTLFNAGVKIGFGSDSGAGAGRFEGYFEHREMELMAEAGLTPAQIIQIATRNSAEILQIDDNYGTIESGKMAELLVLDANPLENISNTKTLEQVWQNGRRIHDLR